MASTTLVSTCASCVFGATATQLLSLSSHVVSTITVEIIPHVTIFANGSAPSTSYETTTETITETEVLSTVSGAAPQTYSSEGEITWTVGDATLTYPTTYLQYLGFAGAPAPTDDSQLCAEQVDATEVTLPATVDTNSLIYALAGNYTAGMPLPSALLMYLDSLPAVASQLDGDALMGCAPLTTTPVVIASVSSQVARSTSGTTTQGVSTPTVTATSYIQKRFEGPRRETPQHPIVTAVEHNGNATLHKRQGSGTGTGTAGTAPPETQAPFTSSASSTTEGLGSIILSEASSETQNVHTTAYVLNTVTAAAVSTTVGSSAGGSSADEPGPSNASPTQGATPQPTTNVAPTPTPDTTQSPTQASAVPDLQGGSSTATQPTFSNLIGGIISAAAAQTQSSNNAGAGVQSSVEQGQSPQQSIQISNLIGDIGSAAAEQTQKGGDAGASSGPQTVYRTVNSAFSKSNGQYYYGTQTLAPSSTITYGSGSSSTTVGLQVSGGSTQLVVGSSTYNVQSGSGSAVVAVAQTGSSQGAANTATHNGEAGSGSGTAAAPKAVFTTNGEVFTAIQTNGAVVLGDSSSTVTISPGYVATFGSVTFDVSPSGSAVLVNGESMQLLTSASPAQAAVTASGLTYTAIQSNGAIVLAGSSSTVTVGDGSVGTFEGETVSALPSGSGIVIGGSTVTLTTGALTTSTGLGGYINSGLNSASATAGSATSSVAGHSGAVQSRSSSLMSMGWMGCIVVGLLFVY